MSEDTNTGTMIPGETEGGSLSPQVNEAIVEKARAKGWTPLETWRGDPEDWVDAREFLGREKLFSKIHTLQKELVNIKNATQKDFQEIGKYFAQMREVEYKRALNDLRAQRREAMQEGDLEKADQLEAQMDEIKEQRLEAKAPEPTATAAADPMFEAWRVENQWFDNDAELRQEAIGIGVGYANANKNASQQQVLEYVTKTIKKFNPDKFGTTARQVDDEGESSLNPVETPTRRSSGSTTRRGKLSVNDLNDVQRSVMKTLINRGVLKEAAAKNNRTQEAEYLAQLAAAEGL